MKTINFASFNILFEILIVSSAPYKLHAELIKYASIIIHEEIAEIYNTTAATAIFPSLSVLRKILTIA